MEMMLWEDTFNANDTEGKLLVDGIFECFTLEPTRRPPGAPKVFGKTAIPYGTYDVVIAYSPHFRKRMPYLIGVPNFSGIMMHPGDFAADTEGCILVGQDIGISNQHSTNIQGFLGSSIRAFNVLFPKINDALAEVGGKVQITIAPFSYDSQASQLTDALPKTD